MAEVILMPRLSDTMTEGVIAAWHKKVGDTVKKGDKLLEVDINSIHEKGYSLETPVLVTNADDYADVIEMASGSVKAGAPLLTALK